MFFRFFMFFPLLLGEALSNPLSGNSLLCPFGSLQQISGHVRAVVAVIVLRPWERSNCLGANQSCPAIMHRHPEINVLVYNTMLNYPAHSRRINFCHSKTLSYHVQSLWAPAWISCKPRRLHRLFADPALISGRLSPWSPASRQLSAQLPVTLQTNQDHAILDSTVSNSFLLGVPSLVFWL